MPDISDIAELLKLLRETGYQEVELKMGDLTIRLGHEAANPAPTVQNAGQTACVATPPPPAAPVIDETGLFEVRADTVGSFFVAPAPGAAPFVQVGDRVTANQQVGLLEVMKLFNAVEAGVDGTVVAVHAKDGAFVEYGEVLMTIRPEAS